MVAKLVVAMRPGESFTPAVARARELASRHLGNVDVLIVSVLFDSHIADHRVGDVPQLELIRTAMLSAEREKLEQVRSHFDGLCRMASVDVVWSEDAVASVIAVSKAFDADILVATAKQRSTLSRQIFSHTDWELMRRSPIPILFARETDFRPYKKVVVAVDPMHSHDKSASLDDLLVARGKELAEAFEGELHIAHVYPRLDGVTITQFKNQKERLQDWEVEHRSEVAKLADRNGIAADHVIIVAGDPQRAIPDLVRAEEADLLIMGSVSRSSFERWMIGHTAEDVLDNIDCDVLVVRAPTLMPVQGVQ